MQKYSLFGYTPNIFHCFFEVFWKGKDKPLKHNQVTGHFFKEWTGRGKRLEGKAHYYIHARVCVCAKGKRRKRAGRIHTEVFRTFLYHLSPVIISVPVHRGLRYSDRLPATYHHTCHLSPAYHPTEDDEGEQ